MKKGFTLIELLIAISVIIILIVISFPVFSFFRKESELNTVSEEIVSILRLTQDKTISSEQGSSWGTYFNDTITPNTITVFKGENYATRDTSEDKTSSIRSSVEIFEIDFNDMGSEITFKRITGEAVQSGHIAIKTTGDDIKERLICIEPYIIGICQRDE